MYEYFFGIYNFVFCIFYFLYLIMVVKINNEDVSKVWFIIIEVLFLVYVNVRVIFSSI